MQSAVRLNVSMSQRLALAARAASSSALEMWPSLLRSNWSNRLIAALAAAVEGADRKRDFRTAGLADTADTAHTQAAGTEAVGEPSGMRRPEDQTWARASIRPFSRALASGSASSSVPSCRRGPRCIRSRGRRCNTVQELGAGSKDRGPEGARPTRPYHCRQVRRIPQPPRSLRLLQRPPSPSCQSRHYRVLALALGNVNRCTGTGSSTSGLSPHL
mmetsp:Transcript_8537/g.18612  ORF Transcript_8537/g.18612 Transcript_8537/m.18612 type:complete len:216 (-) Transcript_8537:489-1136(-)